MNQRLDELRKEMNSKNSGELSGVANHDSLGENTAVKSQKILSEDTAHYILIKSDEKTAEKDKQDTGKDRALITHHVYCSVHSLKLGVVV